MEPRTHLAADPRYCGTPEALEDGAARVVLVESDRAVLALLKRNLRLAELANVTALQARLPEELERRLPAGERFDLVFADPPYGFDEFAALLAYLAHLHYRKEHTADNDDNAKNLGEIGDS